MRSLLLVLPFIVLPVVGQQCIPELTHVLGLAGESRTVAITLATPLENILKALAKLDPKAGGSVFLTLTTTTKIMSGWRATCPFPHCCPAHSDVSVYVSNISWSCWADPFNPFLQLQHTAYVVPEKEERAAWVDHTDKPPVCRAEHTIYGGTLSASLTLGVRVSVGPLSIGYTLSSWELSKWEAEVWASPVASCGAGEGDRCSANKPPTLYGPHYFAIPQGGISELVLIATDPDGADDIVAFRIPKLPAGVRMVQREDKKLDDYTRAVTFYLSTDVFLDPCRPTLKERCKEPSQAYLEVEVVDSCGKNAVLWIPVSSRASAPKLELEHWEFRNGKYWVWFKITDMDRADRFLVEVVEVAGGKVTFVPEGELWCEDVYKIPCEVRFPVIFAPYEDSSEHYFEVKVTDSYGLSASRRWSNPKGPVN